MDDRKLITGNAAATELALPRELGNDAYEGVVLAIRVAPSVVRRIVADVLALIGSTPQAVTVEELSNAMPEIERRLRALLKPDVVTEALKRVQRFLISVIPA